jgi:hypothetical protein
MYQTDTNGTRQPSRTLHRVPRTSTRHVGSAVVRLDVATAVVAHGRAHRSPRAALVHPALCADATAPYACLVNRGAVGTRAAGSAALELAMFTAALLIAGATAAVRDDFPALFCLGLFAVTLPALAIAARRRIQRLPMSSDVMTGAPIAGVAAGQLAVDGWVVEFVYVAVGVVLAIVFRFFGWPKVDQVSESGQV